MKTTELIKDLKATCPTGWGVQRYFEEDNDGGCPCFQGKVKLDEGTLKVWGKCWRVASHKQDLIISGTLPKKLKVKVGNVIRILLNKQKWYLRYTLIIK